MTDLLTAPAAAPEQYQAKGVVLVREVFGADEIANIRQVFTDQVERDTSLHFDDSLPEGDVLARYPRFIHPHRHPETEAGRIAAKLMFDPRVFEIVESLIGPAYGAQSMFYFKPPGARGQALHQDNIFLKAHPETCLAAWIAVDDCDAANGGLRVIPGSHRVELICPEPADESVSFTTLQVAVPADVEIWQTEMRAGDVLFFHGSVVHGSNPNTTSDRFRRSLIFHYVPRASTEVASFYHPLLHPDGSEVSIKEATDGGSCGEGWNIGPH